MRMCAGNRAIIYCSTTDPYQVIRHPDPARQAELSKHSRLVVRRSLELILARSTLNVRVLTRSPLAKSDFDLFEAFGKRLTFGMSLPTLRDDLSRFYEPKAPGPRQRLAALREASRAGLNVFVAMAPTYPECDPVDLEATLQAVADLNPITVFHEPINIRADNVQRIQARATEMGAKLNTEVSASRLDWQRYAMEALLTVHRIAQKVGLGDRLHSWPDKSLGTLAVANALGQPDRHMEFIYDNWNRISEWPR